MLTSITIENFRGIGSPVSVAIKPITLLFGPNSVGKTTVVQTLHYARECLDRQNFNPDRTLYGGKTIDLGGFKSIVNNHDLSKALRLRFDIDLSDVDLPDYRAGLQSTLRNWSYSRCITSAWIQIVIGWSEYLNNPIAFSYQVGLNGFEFAEIQASADGRRIELSSVNFRHPLFQHESDDFSEDAELLDILLANVGFEFNTENDGFVVELANQESAIPNFGKPLEFNQQWVDADLSGSSQELVNLLSQLIVGPGEMLRDLLRNFRYLGPMRESPERNYSPALSVDESRWSNGLSAWDVLYRNGEKFVDQVNSWIRHSDRLDTGYRLHLKTYKELDLASPTAMALLTGNVIDVDVDMKREIAALPTLTRLVLVEESTGVELVPRDVGIGVSQVLPVVVAVLEQKSSFVAIEQPELHVHPAIQTALGDLFISEIANRGVTFLLETHSEHLLLRLLRRIRETSDNELPPGAPALHPDDVSVTYLEPSEFGIVMHQLRVDESGEFVDRWPRGFFEERAGELF